MRCVVLPALSCRAVLCCDVLCCAAFSDRPPPTPPPSRCCGTSWRGEPAPGVRLSSRAYSGLLQTCRSGSYTGELRVQAKRTNAVAVCFCVVFVVSCLLQ